jgi:hypothetical protein
MFLLCFALMRSKREQFNEIRRDPPFARKINDWLRLCAVAKISQKFCEILHQVAPRPPQGPQSEAGRGSTRAPR